MKSFKSYLKEYGGMDPFQPMGGSSHFKPSCIKKIKVHNAKLQVTGNDAKGKK